MPRLYRPHIPLSVRCEVAVRQMHGLTKCEPTDAFGLRFSQQKKPRYRDQLDIALFNLARLFGCEMSELRLDHDPPLAARPLMHKRKTGTIVYKPDANDPDHLVYRPHGPQHAGSHLIKTNVRGDHGQHPDRVLIKKARRAERGPKPKRGPKIQSRGFDKASRPFPKKRSRL